MKPRPRWTTIVLVSILPAVGAGCRSEGEPTYPVAGKVEVRGEPANGALVVFHPLAAPAVGEEAAVRPTANVGPDGTFTLNTDEREGAPAGDYAVTVRWWKLKQEGKDAEPGPDVVPPAYSEPKTSPLKVTIHEGENRLDTFQIR